MKFLLGCTNSDNSIIGYDWDKGSVFWSCKRSQVDVCSVDYHGKSIVAGANNSICVLSPDGSRQFNIKGKHDSHVHSVHVMKDGLIGIADTGNNGLLTVNIDGSNPKYSFPLEILGDLPLDSIHLNDFVETPFGRIVSIFDYRPWRAVRQKHTRPVWAKIPFGVLINLDQSNRIVASGFCSPHSMAYIHPYLYVCSSTSGFFHIGKFNQFGDYVEEGRVHITDKHILRGAYRTPEAWFFGGSAERSHPGNSEIYRLDIKTQKITSKPVIQKGEIYDILPWKEEIMRPIIEKNFGGSTIKNLNPVPLVGCHGDYVRV